MTQPAKIWLSSPHMGETEQQYIKEAFDTNWVAPLGPHVDGFEADLCAFNVVGHAAALTSGTGALHLAMDLLDVGVGDVVLVQSFTFSATANPVTYRGAVPVFIDSEPETWNMDPEALETAIVELSAEGRNPKAIIPVHLYGMPANMPAIGEIADRYGIPVVEDAAESLGSTYNGQKTGTFGLLGVYSFNGNKIITTSGGGALVSDHKELIDRARYLSTQARDPAPHYEHSAVGYNYRMSNVLAGIGRGQMEVLPARIEQRRANFARYTEYFAGWNARGFDIRFQSEPEGSFSNRWLTAILVNPNTNQGLTRETIRLALEQKNIETRPLWKPMHLQPVFRNNPFYGNGHSEHLFDIGLCLPSGSNLGTDEFERIFDALDAVRDNGE